MFLIPKNFAPIDLEYYKYSTNYYNKCCATNLVSPSSNFWNSYKSVYYFRPLAISKFVSSDI